MGASWLLGTWILPSLKTENFSRLYNVSRASYASIKKLCVIVVCADPTIHWLWNESCLTRPWQRPPPSWSQSQVVSLGFQESSMPCCHSKFILVEDHILSWPPVVSQFTLGSHPPVASCHLNLIPWEARHIWYCLVKQPTRWRENTCILVS